MAIGKFALGLRLCHEATFRMLYYFVVAHIEFFLTSRGPSGKSCKTRQKFFYYQTTEFLKAAAMMHVGGV